VALRAGAGPDGEWADDEARWVPTGDDEWELEDTWLDMSEQLHHESRYYNRHVLDFLKELFADVHRLRDAQGQPVIQTITADAQAPLYRARLALNESKLREILMDPARQLGAPKGRLARAGRMNAAGISAFYAAMDVTTCLNEMRPPIGSYVVVGTFESLRPLQLLDLEALTGLQVPLDRCDPGYAQQQRQFRFLNSLAQQFSAPVMPGDEEFDYLLSQLACEHIAQTVKPPLDGVVFPSAQHRGGRNVVLFQRSATVEPWTSPEGQAPGFWIDEHDEGGRSYYLVDVLSGKGRASAPDITEGRRLPGPLMDAEDPRFQPTLRLQHDGIQVHHIEGVRFSTVPSAVQRSYLGFTVLPGDVDTGF
jgi:hypothetical protein